MEHFGPAELEPPAKKKREEDDLDLTPMVDVTFLLLIFFMITAAFALQKSIQVPPADDDEAAAVEIIEEEEEDLIVVRVDELNAFWVGAPLWPDEKEAGPSIPEMRKYVRQARDGKGGKFGKGPSKLLVQAHGDAGYKFVIAALDTGSAVGVQEIRLRAYEDGEL